MSAPTLLLLESDDLAVSRFADVFKHSSFVLVATDNFRDAFSQMKILGRCLSAVILDFELATDDVDIFERMRKLDFDRPIPVVLMGQVKLNPDEIAQLMRDSGYAGYLFKGLSDEEILGHVGAIALMEKDQRVFPRILFEVRALCHFNQESFIAETYTLSQNGLFIKSQSNLPRVKNQGTLVFESGGQKVQVKVEVVHVRAFDSKTMSIHPTGFAVRFLETNMALTQVLDDLFKKYGDDHTGVLEIKS